MTALTKAEQIELKKIDKAHRKGKATYRQLQRGITLRVKTLRKDDDGVLRSDQ